MRVVAFNGSSRRDGNTAILLRTVLNELEAAGIETELIQLAGTRIEGCRACRVCFERKNQRCAVEDDPMNEWIEKIIASEGVILGSPVYIGDLTASMKALIERVDIVARANGDFLKRKVGAAVVAARRAGAIHAFDSINHFFLLMQMVIPGANHWNVGIGRDFGDVREDVEGIEIMKSLGKNMAWLINCIGMQKEKTGGGVR